MPVSRDVIKQALADNLILDAIPEAFDVLGTRYSGKVRENFTRGDERVIIVSDRVSAFDHVLGTIPFKGQVLNGLARHWFAQTADQFPNHLRSVPDAQVTVASECEPIKVEMVVRGYLTGSSSTSIWRAYESGSRSFCGHTLPEGLARHQKLPTNLVTPATKAAKGEHDQNASKAELVEMGLITAELFDELEQRCLALFARGQELAAERGLILVDTKYELGRRPDGEIVLIDEIHTPDSSRYWYIDGYDASMAAGEDPRSLDKEYVRRWLVEQGFRGEGTPPALSDEVRIEAAARYIETFEQVTGTDFVPDLRPPLERLRAALL
ncbi:phosphoribosylaminoimidazole-succinocarboxamide synthase [Plesiocystis pacifica SIR-1]|uniref:Phosphoribosylaminoimidazole-succinocarboxamide synthase n=1 Tax=Plesiocystis pacifica SIR-1 TaxID=391625 RepID=A6GJB5_9BACT|nr:phosphoribosylaminoimidazolesuccinocarboxamide synthase [Plesiocystis pacifica]EDM74033.1 phosphoribosylaminoimidazole-succinocarboxamide synthase [Plesiocystis pacifica SIR-1]